MTLYPSPVTLSLKLYVGYLPPDVYESKILHARKRRIIALPGKLHGSSARSANSYD